jgi:hypothetical protein
MRELIVRDDREVRRLDHAIAALGGRSDRDRLRLHHLLSALVAARNDIGRSRRPSRASTSHAVRRPA